MLVEINRITEMQALEQDDTAYRVRYGSYLVPVLLACVTPALIYQQYDRILDGSLTNGELVGLGLGFLIPALALHYLLEFSSFTFLRSEGVLRWTWRNLFIRRSGEVAFSDIVKVQREARDTSEAAGLQYTYRLVVMLQDGSLVPLSRGYSGLYTKQLDQIVDEIREFLGQHNLN